MKPTDIRIDQVSFGFEDFRYRTPIKFGGTALDRATILNVNVTISTRNGRRARGFGSMPLGNVWSFPSKLQNYEGTLAAMKALTQRIAKIMGECKDFGHPIDLSLTLEPYYEDAAHEVEADLQLPEKIPVLCTLVCASPFDAALHDAFGKAHGLNCYRVYGTEFMNHDLGHYLGTEFQGESLERYVHKSPQPRLPVYHLVGALDPLEDKDVDRRVGDRLPETLPEWICADGLTHIKIKLNGEDLAWDVKRVVSVDRVASAAQAQRGTERWVYSLDFNEKCPSVSYLLDFLHQVEEQTSAGFARIQYIEQPTARDLKANRHNVMHEASRIRPVVIDESLIDLESLKLAREMGYTGAAFKACKGQSQTLLLAAAAQKFGMFLCVQDLTCPGASLIHSAGLAAHIPGVAAIEANARQYAPSANKPWQSRFPGIFQIKDGTMATETLTGPGLGAVE
ncbi:MAG TPA: enolase C-terminal domain-like protein [Gemmataceae bacterium]|jgi:L-alanine-DL-glutamate epimerase-like enolase superfamily enzyme|nr:enolase C-terminal domain-like protein [Gemmataceae bacterium]